VSMDIDNALPKDQQALKNDSQFKEMVKYNIEGKKVILWEQEDLKKYILSVQQEIERQLE